MRFTLVALVAFSASNAFAGGDLTCISKELVDGWIGVDTHRPLTLTGRMESSESLKDAVLTGAYQSDRRDLLADEGYQPRNPRYAGMNRFSVLEDAWCWFAPLLPKDVSSRQRKFTAYIQTVCEGGRVKTVPMVCDLK